MPDRRKPPRRPLGFFDARDRILHLNNAYRVRAFTNEPLDSQSRRFEKELAEVETREPDEELEDAELSDDDWRQAMAAERLRRERERK